MKVLTIRHAIAQEMSESGNRKGPRTDAARTLTKDGREKMEAAAAGLREIVSKIDVLVTSPLVRAVQTGEIVAKEFGRARATQLAALEPGKPVNAVLHWLQGQTPTKTIALVGHEPQLGILISWLLTGEQRSFVKLRKGSACLLDFEDDIKAGKATLLWLVKPSHMRKLSK